MINVLFTLVLVEMGVIVVLLFKSPLRKLMMMGLDRGKQGRGPLVARTVATTLIVVLGSVVYNFTSVQNRLRESSLINPTDQVLMANHLLEASLLGFSLFLAMLIDRLHYYMKELELLRRVLDSAKKHPRDRAGKETEGGGIEGYSNF
ncbi:hypothetical protein MLD38_022077 [Melastoma candidum]|uniref:Uncharacterized protein n=1 Tax=Melastoma candidum TaxID=119954 RepID=A0ACB9QHF1_9MYRT|nr:hypothetical protein MLD38_022077 [Melastoma candidum]